MSAAVRIRILRNFRMKHRVSLQEIADASGKSPQWISQMELHSAANTSRNRYTMLLAFGQVICERKRRLANMEEEYTAMKQKFFEEEPEWRST